MLRRPHGSREPLRRHRHRGGPQRPRDRRPPRQAGSPGRRPRAPPGRGGAAITGTTLGSRLQGDRPLLRDEPDAGRAVLRELELERHGYKIYPQHGYFAPRADGRYLQMHADEKRRHAEISKFSPATQAGMEKWDAWPGRARCRARPAPRRRSSQRRLESSPRPRPPDRPRVEAPRARPEEDRRHHAAHDDERRRSPRRSLRVPRAQRRPLGERRDRDLGRAALAGDGVRDGASQDRRPRARGSRRKWGPGDFRKAEWGG